MVKNPQISGCEFIADTMLCGLVRWLRFLGFSICFAPTFDQLRRYAENFPRAIVLTPSRKHLERIPSTTSLLLQSNHIEEQLAEMNQAFGIFSRIRFLTRCSLCNSPLEKISREKIQQEIPVKVLQVFREFYYCPVCEKIYWEGGHVIRLKEKLKRMKVPI